jgi:hypothetical protein
MVRVCGVDSQKDETSTGLCGQPAHVAFMVKVYMTVTELANDGIREPAILLLCERHAREGWME